MGLQASHAFMNLIGGDDVDPLVASSFLWCWSGTFRHPEKKSWFCAWCPKKYQDVSHCGCDSAKFVDVSYTIPFNIYYHIFIITVVSMTPLGCLALASWQMTDLATAPLWLKPVKVPMPSKKDVKAMAVLGSMMKISPKLHGWLWRLMRL